MGDNSRLFHLLIISLNNVLHLTCSLSWIAKNEEVKGQQDNQTM